MFSNPKLSLNRETLRLLQAPSLDQVHGGGATYTCSCAVGAGTMPTVTSHGAAFCQTQ